MAFATAANGTDIEKTKSGELQGDGHLNLNYSSFEDGLKIGRFAKLDAGRLDNLDASATPVIAGVVTRYTNQIINSTPELTYNTDVHKQVSACRSGLITIDVVAADTPTQFGQVYVKNTNDADGGKATTVNDATTQAIEAEFIEQRNDNVWLINIYGKI